MARKHIKLYYDDNTDFKKRLDNVKGSFHDTTFCLIAVEEKIAKLEKQKKGKR